MNKILNVMMAALLGLSILLSGGCTSDKKPTPSTPPAKQTDQTSTKNSQDAANTTVTAKLENENNTAPAEKIDSVDQNIPVSKEEMDKFIDVAKFYQLGETDVSRLVRILKQCGVDVMNAVARVEAIQKQKPITSAMAPIEFETLGYWIHLSNEYNPSFGELELVYYSPSSRAPQKDFNISYKFYKEYYPLYDYGRFCGNLADLDILPLSDGVYQKIYNEIVAASNTQGKFVRLEWHSLSEPEIITGMDALKKSLAVWGYDSRGLKLSTTGFLSSIVESKVYGEGEKELHVSFTFSKNGDVLDARLGNIKFDINR